MADSDSIAADMRDSLAQDGFQVTSVKPWASANTDQNEMLPELDLTLGRHGPAFPLNFLG